MPKTAADAHGQDKDLLDWLTLYLTPGIGAAGAKKLVDFFGSPGKVLKADEHSLTAATGLKKAALEQLRHPVYKDAEAELDNALKQGIRIISYTCSEYPQNLRSLHNPPVILYVRGDLETVGSPLIIAIVGSRAATSYGMKTAEFIAGSLASRDVPVVSGLALGIDAAAHRGAIQAGGKTLAVLGCGLDITYPSQNRDLFNSIPSAGVLISEYPLGTKPDAFRFPARNRIISGLSHGVVVVEAGSRSGSLITAKLALEQGREVFAIPGRIDSFKSEGTHRLLQDGAKLVHSVDDILEEFSYIAAPKTSKGMNKPLSDDDAVLTDDELLIISVLDLYPKTIDDIIQNTGLSAQTVNERLLHLELKGRVEVLPGKQYKRT